MTAPPAQNPDVTPDDGGNVHPNAAKHEGMSTAVSIAALPAFRRPPKHGGTENAAGFNVWGIETTQLGSDLIAFQDSPTHITIGPARLMSLAEFRAALAATQASWKVQ